MDVACTEQTVNVVCLSVWTQSFLTVCRDMIRVGLGDEEFKGHLLHLCSLVLLSGEFPTDDNMYLRKNRILKAKKGRGSRSVV